MEAVAVVTVLLLAQLFTFAIFVGVARQKYGVPAPAMSGNEIFERTFRVHQNTLEQLVIVIPAMWLFGWYLNAIGAALLGLVFGVSRVLYYRTYIVDPKQRGIGFGLGAIATLFLLIGALVGTVIRLF